LGGNSEQIGREKLEAILFVPPGKYSVESKEFGTLRRPAYEVVAQDPQGRELEAIGLRGIEPGGLMPCREKTDPWHEAITELTV